jgi:hypothetical protein
MIQNVLPLEFEEMPNQSMKMPPINIKFNQSENRLLIMRSKSS